MDGNPALSRKCNVGRMSTRKSIQYQLYNNIVNKKIGIFQIEKPAKVSFINIQLLAVSSQLFNESSKHSFLIS